MQKLEERIGKLEEILNPQENFLKRENLNLLTVLNQLDEQFTKHTQSKDFQNFLKNSSIVIIF